MRRSTRSSLLSAFASLTVAQIHRLSQRLVWLAVVFGLGLGAFGGVAGAARAQPDGYEMQAWAANCQIAGAARAQPDGYEMQAWAANCQIVPPLPPTLNEAGCVAAMGAYVEFVAEDGSSLGGCTTNQITGNGQAAGCSVIIPFSTRGQAYLDTSTIDGAFAPQVNPIGFQSPDPGPVDGIVGFPIFVNLPAGGSGQTDQAQPIEQAQQAAPADRYAYIITGTCADPGSPLDGRIDVFAPQGDPLGLPTALIAESGGGSIAVALDDLFASPHAVLVVTPSDGQGTNVACGDLGTVVDDDAVAVIGLRPAQGSAMAGIAYLATEQGTGQTMVSIFLSEGLGETA